MYLMSKSFYFSIVRGLNCAACTVILCENLRIYSEKFDCSFVRKKDRLSVFMPRKKTRLAMSFPYVYTEKNTFVFHLSLSLSFQLLHFHPASVRR